MTAHLELSRSASGGRPAVVAPPHPLYGGRMDNPVVETIVEALGECGYAPLRFNWRGIGASTGRASGRVEDAVADYLTVLAEARQVQASVSTRTGARALAAGYSFGAIAAAEVALVEPTAVERLLLVAPPITMLESVDVASWEVPVHVVVGDQDSFAMPQALADVLRPARDVRLDVVPDADHFFARSFWRDSLGDLVRAWLR